MEKIFLKAAKVNGFSLSKEIWKVICKQYQHHNPGDNPIKKLVFKSPDKFDKFKHYFNLDYATSVL